MKLDKIIVDRYKSIVTPQTLFIHDGLSTFIGKNNSGKSTILDALYRFFRQVNNESRYADSQSHIELSVSFTSKDRVAISKSGAQNIPESVRCILSNEEFLLKTEDETKPAPKELLQFFTSRTIRIGAIRDLDFVKMKKLFEEFQSGWPKSFKLFTNKLHLFFPSIKTPSKLFQNKKNGIETTVKENGGDRPLDRLGLGFRHMFIMLLYYYHPRYDIILIDEPEIHLHPQMIKRLHDIFLENIANKQIFITSHNPLFIQPESLKHVYRTVQDAKKGTHFHYLPEKNLDGPRLIQELNADNCEMFLADHVLLVEGISDRIFIRELLTRFYPDVSVDVKVIPVHGKENIDTYAKLLDAFHIHYSVLLDKDAFLDTNIRVISNVRTSSNFEAEQARLREHGIFILPYGNLEQQYPKRLYNRDLTKPMLALHVSRLLTQEDLQDGRMKYITEVLDHITKIK